MTLHFIPWHLFSRKVNSLYPSTSFLAFSIPFYSLTLHFILLYSLLEKKRMKEKKDKRGKEEKLGPSHSHSLPHIKTDRACRQLGQIKCMAHSFMQQYIK